MSKIITDPNDISWKGTNCDSRKSESLESIVSGVPKTTCNLGAMGSGMFPPAFNKLREVLYNEHYDLWEVVGGMMIYNHEYLFEAMNTVLDTHCNQLMTMNEVCEVWLKKLADRPKCWRGQ